MQAALNQSHNTQLPNKRGYGPGRSTHNMLITTERADARESFLWQLTCSQNNPFDCSKRTGEELIITMLLYARTLSRLCLRLN